jgi:hypothetical protein
MAEKSSHLVALSRTDTAVGWLHGCMVASIFKIGRK